MLLGTGSVINNLTKRSSRTDDDDDDEGIWSVGDRWTEMTTSTHTNTNTHTRTFPGRQFPLATLERRAKSCKRHEVMCDGVPGLLMLLQIVPSNFD